MSTQKGNSQRTRPQKHKNRSAFKNTLHDTSNRTKLINSTQVSDVCVRCKEIIEWKIKYKKYKPLTQPKTCVKCGQKNVKQAYHVMCVACGRRNGVCTKCCSAKEVVAAKPNQQEQLKLDNETKTLMQTLPERKKRTFLRYMGKKNREVEVEEKTAAEGSEDLKAKLAALLTEERNEDDEGADSDFDACDFSSDED